MSPKRKHRYLINEISRAWFRFGFMEFTGERPKITDRVDAFRFSIDGVQVSYKQKNICNEWEVECPQCRRPVRCLYKYPEKGAKWGCKLCVPHGWVRTPLSLFKFFRIYNIERVLKMTPKELRKACGMDAIKMIHHIISQPEGVYQSVWSFRPMDSLQWRTDDDRVPCVEKLCRKRNLNGKNRQRKIRMSFPMQTFVFKALKEYAADNGMTMPRCANALIRWALANQDIVQIRPV